MTTKEAFDIVLALAFDSMVDEEETNTTAPGVDDAGPGGRVRPAMMASLEGSD